MIAKPCKSPLTWYGGKAKLVGWILPIIESYPHTGYIEPFGGGASILLAKQPGFEVYNDLHGNVVNLFRVIQSPETFGEFERRVALMPYSREVFGDAVRRHEEVEDPVERAALFFVFARQSFSGKQSRANCGWKHSIRESRCRVSQTVQSWLAAVDRLPRVHARLRTVQIENMDAIQCVRKYAHDCQKDGKHYTSLVYCDPPYPLSTRSGGVMYDHELTDDQHRELVRTLLDVPGHKVVSAYEHEIYRPLLDAGWEIVRKTVFCNTLSKTHAQRGMTREQRRRVECLYCSPGRTKTLFDD